MELDEKMKAMISAHGQPRMTDFSGLSCIIGGWINSPLSEDSINGSHRYEDVAEDIRLFATQSKKNGYIWLDDYNGEYYPGVQTFA